MFGMFGEISMECFVKYPLYTWDETFVGSLLTKSLVLSVQ